MLDMMQMLKSGDFSDLTINCRGHQRRVHRVVVCGQSPVLKTMCSEAFQEASSGVLELSDHIVADLDRLLDYLYRGDYTDVAASSSVITPQEAMSSALVSYANRGKQAEDEDQSVPLRHARMYAIGDRYGIDSLKDLAKLKFVTTVYKDGASSGTFPKLLEYVYTSTPDSDRGLRDHIQHICGLSAKILMMHQDVIDLMLAVPTVAVDMNKGLLAWLEIEETSKQEHLEFLYSQHLEEKRELDQSATQMAHRMSKVTEKLKEYQALVAWLRNCDGCQRAFSMSGTMDPLQFQGCLKCQDAPRV
ncbi:hypothetical protein MMC26_005834 [Xylographa opegraphella]|nr:hypothetical protein [Xylographa opegraphella]